MNPTDKATRTGALLSGLVLALAFATAVAQTPAKPRLPTGDPCTVVPLADVQKAFPGAQAGVRRRDVEKYGMTQCAFSHSKGYMLFGSEEYISDSATVMQDAQGAAFGYLDPMSSAAKQGARYEKLAGLGVDAIAFIETRDPQRGIVGDGAFLLLRKGSRVVTLQAPMLAGTDRVAALKLLTELGRIAAKRLE